MSSSRFTKPLRSVSFSAQPPPSVNGYNTFLAGPTKLGEALPDSIGHIASTSTTEMYDFFLKRANEHEVAEAGKLIAQMQADAGKGLTAQVYAGSQKECVVAYKNALSTAARLELTRSRKHSPACLSPT